MKKLRHAESCIHAYNNAHTIVQKRVAVLLQHSVHYISHKQCTSHLTPFV